MSFPRYSKYKDSGVEWLGEVPESWKIRKLSQSFRAQKGKNGQMLTKEFCAENAGGYPVYSGQTENEGVMGTWNQYEFDAGDQGVLFSTTVGSGKVMSVRHLFGKFSLSQNCMIIRTTRRDCQIRFFFYHFQPLFEFERGLIPQHMQASFRMEDLYSYRIALPPLSEQTAIATFLDRETAKIDVLVAEQRRLMELLKEKRQAVISHAVTKGLNPDAPMKPSGIEWLGDVPAHWDTLTIARISTKITNGYVGPTRDILVEDGVPYIQATHIKRGQVNFDGGYFVTQRWSDSHAKSILAEGDVLIVQTGAGTGDVGLVSSAEIGFNCHALIIVACDKEQLLGAFLASVLQSEYGRQKLESIQTGGMHPHLNCGNVKFLEVPVPPKKEQLAIVSYVSESCEKFDTLTAEAQRAIDLLQERRIALISAAVTGQIDVRGLATESEAA